MAERVGSHRFECARVTVVPSGATIEPMEPQRVAELIERRGGIASTKTLIAAGATRTSLRRAVQGNCIDRVREGVYAVPSVDPKVREAAAHGGTLACVSALRAHGVWVLDDAELHVWLGARGRHHEPATGATGQQPRRCACVRHRDAGRAGFGIVSLVQALVQVARCQGVESFFAAFESAWQLGKLTRADRVDIRAELPAGMRWLVDFARHDAGSGIESLLRLRVSRLGLRPDCQVSIVGVGRVDFVFAGYLIVEIDGRENHEGQSKRHKDLSRDAAAAALGYATLRFDYAMVVHDWPSVEAAILGRLGLLGSRVAVA